MKYNVKYTQLTEKIFLLKLEIQVSSVPFMYFGIVLSIVLFANILLLLISLMIVLSPMLCICEL